MIDSAPTIYLGKADLYRPWILRSREIMRLLRLQNGESEEVLLTYVGNTYARRLWKEPIKVV